MADVGNFLAHFVLGGLQGAQRRQEQHEKSFEDLRQLSFEYGLKRHFLPEEERIKTDEQIRKALEEANIKEAHPAPEKTLQDIQALASANQALNPTPNFGDYFSSFLTGRPVTPGQRVSPEILVALRQKLQGLGVPSPAAPSPSPAATPLHPTLPDTAHIPVTSVADAIRERLRNLRP